jgi:hypothetical protein
MVERRAAETDQPAGAATGRRQRSDGERSRRAILTAAAELATVDAAREIFDREVTDRAATAAEGLPRLRATCEAFLDHLDRGVVPGGCFFVSAAVELDAKEGRLADHLREVYAEIIDDLVVQAVKAVELGELAATTDVGQLVFELDSLMLGANVAVAFFKDPQALDRARRGIDARVEAARA